MAAVLKQVKLSDRGEIESLRSIYWWANPLNWLRPTPVSIKIDEELHEIDTQLVRAVVEQETARSRVSSLRAKRAALSRLRREVA